MLASGYWIADREDQSILILLDGKVDYRKQKYTVDFRKRKRSFVQLKYKSLRILLAMTWLGHHSAVNMPQVL